LATTEVQRDIDTLDEYVRNKDLGYNLFGIQKINYEFLCGPRAAPALRPVLATAEPIECSQT
jgi:hypothetical protein